VRRFQKSFGWISWNGTSWECISHSAEDTIQRGRELASRFQPPLVVMLFGELGVGKTTLTKGIVSGLGAAREEDVTSPTFTLVHVFHNPAAAGQPAGAGKVYHVDLYRVADFHDLETIGLDDVLAEPAVVVVEWSEKLTLRTDWPVVHVHLEQLEDESRRIRISDSSGVLMAAGSGK